MARLKLYFLGSPRIELDGALVDTDRRKAVALLAYLAVTGQTHTREALATLLWPDYDQSSALAYLRRTLWELNNMLGDTWLDVRREHVSAADAVDMWVDVAVLRRRVRDCSGPPNDACLDSLTAAVALYEGDFLAGFTLRDSPGFDDWQSFQAEDLRQMLAEALEMLVAGHAERGEWDTAVTHARRWVTLDPLNEAAQRRLMTVYALQGQRAAALRQYETAVQALEEALGVPPEPATTALYEQIRAGELAPSVPTPIPHHAAAEPAPPAEPAHHLPADPRPFVGRREELDELQALLAAPETHLLTLVGPGGIGKTRLALQMAQVTRGAFRDGAHFVPLAAVSDMDEVVPVLARVLEFPLSEERAVSHQQQLLEYLRNKEMLLVLDNFEHLLNGKPPLPSAIMEVAPQVKMLATSRIRLNVRGEQLYPVAGMKTPALETAVAWQDAAAAQPYSAIQLFAQAAQRVHPDFALSADNLVFITRICELVQGMPLAIELAATWMEMLSPMEIAVEIAKNIDFLATEMRDVPERQRSIRAVFDHSWNLLTPREQEIFPQLTLFRRSFVREAAQAVSGASLRDLLGLVNKSLLQREGDARFQIHELLRQYAQEKLAALSEQATAAQARFNQFFSRFLVEQGVRMQGPQQMEAKAAVEEEWPNVRAAWLGTLQQGDYDLIDASIEALIVFLVTQTNARQREVEGLLEKATGALQAKASGRDERLLYARLLALRAWAGTYDWAGAGPAALGVKALRLADELDARAELGVALLPLAEVIGFRVDAQLALELAETAVASLSAQGNKWGTAMAWYEVGNALWASDTRDEALDAFRESITLFAEIDSPVGLAYAMSALAGLLTLENRHKEAYETYSTAREIFEAIGDRLGLARVLEGLGSSMLSTGDYAESYAYYQSGRELYEGLNDRLATATAYAWESIAARHAGDMARALQTREAALALYREVEDVNGVVWSIWELGEIQRQLGNFEEARRRYEESYRSFVQYDIQRGIAFYHQGLGDLALAESDYDAAEMHLSTSLKLAMKEPHLYGESYSRSRLAEVALARGDVETAVLQLYRALQIARAWYNQGLLSIALLGLARLALVQGAAARAIELATVVAERAAAYGETREEAQALLAQVRSEVGEKATVDAQARGRSHDLDALVDELLDEYEPDV